MNNLSLHLQHSIPSCPESTEPTQSGRTATSSKFSRRAPTPCSILCLTHLLIVFANRFSSSPDATSIPSRDQKGQAQASATTPDTSTAVNVVPSRGSGVFVPRATTSATDSGAISPFRLPFAGRFGFEILVTSDPSISFRVSDNGRLPVDIKRRDTFRSTDDNSFLTTNKYASGLGLEAVDGESPLTPEMQQMKKVCETTVNRPDIQQLLRGEVSKLQQTESEAPSNKVQLVCSVDPDIS